MDPITIGLTAIGSASSIFGGLFGSHKNNNQNFSWFSMANAMIDQQANTLRQQQMNIDATRRKRDIIRQAQVATANAENAAANQGALNSSGVEGGRAGITGQMATNLQGVEWNQEIGNEMFGLENQRSTMGMIAGAQKASQRTNFWDMFSTFGGGLNGKNIEQASKLGQWGWGKISNL